ncbi:MAG: MATE family efflux transporter [Candidatus Lambdaproteobacteria bacterium]|nr:MATE family efflux transporter [Candidatus Lambdaproteobacteria bacterium]
MRARNLTTGPILHLLLVLGLPNLGAFALQSVYALTDLYFVGGLGAPAIAGLGISINTFFIVLALGQSIGIGGLAMISQAYGRGEHDSVPQVYQQVFLMVLIAGSALWAGMALLAESYVGLFTRDAEVFRQGVAYFRLYAMVFLTQVFLMTCGMCWRAVGDFITPMRLMALSVALNIGLDPLLIYGLGPVPALGIAGAALATIASQLAACAVYLWMIFGSRRNTLLVVRAPLRLDWRLQVRLLRIGVPSGVRDVLFSASLMLVYYFVQRFGADASAAVGVGFRIIQTGVLPTVAIGAAVAALVGQNFGAQRHERVLAAMLWGTGASVAILSLEYALVASFPSFWVGLFTTAPGVLALGRDYLLITGLILPAYSVTIVLTFAAQGLGRTMQPLVAQTVRVAALFAFLLAAQHTVGLTVHGVFWSGTGASILETLYMLGVLWHIRRQLLGAHEAAAAEQPAEAPT